MENKMLDLAICGRIVMTPEVHKIAMEKYGVMSNWRKIYLLYQSIKMLYFNKATTEAAIDIFNEYTINADDFDTPLDLYNVINMKYKEIYLVSL